MDTVRELRSDPTVDLWFEDETAFWTNPPPYRVWAMIGTTPVLPCVNAHERCNVMGAVRPSDGAAFTLIVSHGNARMLQIFVNEIQPYLNPVKRTFLILDNAKFHHGKQINWGKIEPLYLPAYSPELNPIETLWLFLKQTFFKGWIPSKQIPLDERVFKALKFVDQHSDKVKSICAMSVYFWGLFPNRLFPYGY